MLSSRLHELTESALHNVLRHLSSKPSKLDWVSFVQIQDALMAVHPSIPLRDAMLESLTRLVVEESRESDD